VANRGAGAERARVVAYRVQQMSLAQAGRRMQEQWVVGLARILGDGECGRMGEAIAIADDELVEAVAGVERLGGVGGQLSASEGGPIREAQAGPEAGEYISGPWPRSGLIRSVGAKRGKKHEARQERAFRSRNGRCVYWLATRLGLVSYETHLSAEEAQTSED